MPKTTHRQAGIVTREQLMGRIDACTADLIFATTKAELLRTAAELRLLGQQVEKLAETEGL